MSLVSLATKWLDFLFPSRCCQCGCWGVEGLCGPCWRDYPSTRFSLGPAALQVLGGGEYRDGLRSAVLELKEQGRPGLARALARALAGRLQRVGGDWLRRRPILVPIPASPGRSRWRGHRPVEALALTLAERLALPCQVEGLCLVGDPAPRKALTREQRRSDQTLRFRAAAALSGPVLLVDDVVTSGETLLRAARAFAQGQVLGAVVVAYSGGPQVLPEEWERLCGSAQAQLAPRISSRTMMVR